MESEIKFEAAKNSTTRLCMFDFLRRLDPSNLITQFLNGIDQGSHIPRNIVEKMYRGHG